MVHTNFWQKQIWKNYKKNQESFVNKRKKKQIKQITKHKKYNKINMLFYMAKQHKAYEFSEDGKKMVIMTAEYYDQLQEEKEELIKKIKENLELLN